MNNRELVKMTIEANKDAPVLHHWMGFFNAELAKKLTPSHCHYDNMWLYDTPEFFDFSAMGQRNLDKMVDFNHYVGQCFISLGKGANISFGHGGPGEFFNRIIKRSENELVAEYETTVKAKVQFNPHFYHFFDHPIETIEDIKKLQLPDADNPQRYVGFAEDAAYLKSKGEYVIASLNGFFSGLHYFFMDYQQVLMATILDTKLIDEILQRLGNWNLTAAKNMVKSGADCIVLCDDLGSKQNMLISPQQYREIIKPWHKKLCQTVHELGATVHLHSHGAIEPVLDDFVECGFDFVNPFDPEEGYDIEEILKKYSSEFVVVGGVPASFWQWDADQQDSYLKKMVKLAQKYKRFILMDSGGIPEHVSREAFERINNFSKTIRGLCV